MTIRETYSGRYSRQQIFAELGFIGSDPVVKMDKAHDRITFTDPADAGNSIILDTKDLDTGGGAIIAGTVQEIHFMINGKEAISLTGLAAPAADLNTALPAGVAGLYEYLTDALTGNIIATGDKFGNIIEIGAGGKATVDAGGGNDEILISHQKNAVIDGGKGTDTLAYDTLAGDLPVSDGVASIDLAAGTGTNPFGGTLTIKNVENLTNMFAGTNNFRGDGHDNVFRGGAHADTLIGRGGDDDIYIRMNYSADPRATLADGGTGNDTLHADLSEAPGAPFTGTGDSIRFHNKLDLEHPEDNLGTFHGGTFRNFETYRVSGWLNKDEFDFSGSEAAERVFSAGSDDHLDGRGGNDLLFGGDGADLLTGGKGADIFQYSLTTQSSLNPTLRDTITDFSQAQHDRIDLHLIDANGAAAGNGKFHFIGTKAFDGQAGEVTVATTVGGDTLVIMDVNGDKLPDMALVIDGDVALMKGDFML